MSPDQSQFGPLPAQEFDQHVPGNEAMQSEQQQLAQQAQYDQMSGRLAPENYPASVPQPEAEVVLLEWLADSRVSQQRSREYYSSLLVVVILVSLILFFANQVLLIFVVWSFLFITYVLGMVKAETIHNMITNYGIRYRNTLYFWQEMQRFWVMDNHGRTEIHIEIPRMLGGQMILLSSNPGSPIQVDGEEIVDLLQRYVPYEQPIPSQIDKWLRWFEEKFPLESSASEDVSAVPSEQDVPVVQTPLQVAEQPQSVSEPSVAVPTAPVPVGSVEHAQPPTQLQR